ncbi:hypothetical protein JCM10207_000662 [Rhodosporidiobolus poonsookiae]
MRTPTLLRVLAVVAFAGQSAATRKIRILNQCSYSVWPAVSPFADQKEAYADTRGWEMKAGESKTITVSDTFTGRIWGRHACVAQSDSTVVCVTSSCSDNLLECGDGELGVGTALELRLGYSQNGQYDVIDLMNGAGWSMPVAVKPEADNCDPISCTPDLDSCPDDKMKLQDSYGEILGCMSSCYAGIGDSAVQCCSGDYAKAESCTPDLIQYYDYFKSSSCKNAYAYFEDSRQGSDQVQFLCSSSGNPGFTFAFCPNGDGGSSSGTASGTATGTSDADATSAGQPTGTAVQSADDVPALTSSLSIIISGPASSSASSTSGSNSTSVASAASSSASKTNSGSSDTSAAMDSDSSSTSTGDGEGLSSTMLWAIGAGAVIIVIVVAATIGFVVHRSHQQRAAAAASAGAAAPMMQAAGAGRNPAQTRSTPSRTSSRTQRPLLSESDASRSDSEPSSSDDACAGEAG